MKENICLRTPLKSVKTSLSNFDSGGLKSVVYSLEEGELRALVGELLHLGASTLASQDSNGWAAFADWSYKVGQEALISLR